MSGLWRASRALLVAELRIQVREYMTWIWLLVGAVAVGAGIAWISGNTDGPLFPDIELSQDEDEGELPDALWSVQGELPAWAEDAVKPRGQPANIELVVTAGSPPVLSVGSSEEGLRDQATKALRKARRAERARRMDALDVASSRDLLDVEVVEDAVTDSLSASPLGLGTLAAVLMYLTVASMLVESIPRSRDTGYLSTLLTLDVPRAAMLLAWSLAAMAWGTLAVAAMAVGWNLGASFVDGPLERVSLALLGLPAVAVLSAASTLRLVVTARDLRAASARLGIAPLLGMALFLAAGQAQTLWGDAAGALVPVGGLALALASPTAGMLALSTLSSLLTSWALFAWTAQILEHADDGDSQTSPVVRRRARGDWLPEVLLLAAIGVTGSAAWGGTLTERLGQPALGIAILMVFFYGLPAVIAPWIWGQPVRPLLSLRAAPRRSLLLAPFIALLSVPLSGALVLGTRWLTGTRIDDAAAVGEALMEMASSPGGILAMSLGPGLCEELLFRGALLGLLRRRFSTWTAIGIQAALFALVHGHPMRIPPTLLLGVLTGWLVVRTRSLWPAVLLHTAHNATSFLLAGDGSEPQWTATLVAATVLSGLLGAGALLGATRR